MSIFSSSKLDQIYESTFDNKYNVEKIINEFPQEDKKYTAAIFILENMLYHNSLSGSSIDAFRNGLDSCVTNNSINNLWSAINDDSFYEKDLHTIKYDYIINDINIAYSIWHKVPWAKDVQFETFCELILPYKIINEPLVEWRQFLFDKYYPYVKDASTSKEAFEMIYNIVYEEFRVDNGIRFPYHMDPLMLDKIKRGKCDDRSLYMLAVLKSLCIPAVYDITPYWANYSNSGHAWVSFVNSDGIVCIANRNKDDLSHNYIDATFTKRKHLIKSFDDKFSVDSLKKIARIFRYSYNINQERLPITNLDIPDFLKNIYMKDVTAQYGLQQQNIALKYPNIDSTYLSLCSFNNKFNWYPVLIEKNEGQDVIFKDVVSDLVYLPTLLSHKGMIPISNPILLKGNKIDTLIPNNHKLRSIVLKRKYFVWTHWVNRWEDIFGGIFEAADDRRFTQNVIELERIDTVSTTKMTFLVDSKRPYRFFRFRNPSGQNAPIAELEFYNDKKELLKGRIDGRAVDKKTIINAFDGNINTAIYGKENYWISLDTGEGDEQIVKQINIKLADDGNFIDVGDEYELMFYDMGWKSLGSIVANADSLIYHNVPENALLWLRNKTRGKEERIFTYENNRQIWW